jgi:hypothetical protein
MIYLHLKVKRERVAVHTGRPLLIGAFQLPQPKPAPARKCPCCGAPMLRVMTFLAPWQSCRAPPPPKPVAVRACPCCGEPMLRIMTIPPILTAGFIRIHGQGAGEPRAGLGISMLGRLPGVGIAVIRRAIRRPARQNHPVRIAFDRIGERCGPCPVRQPQT